MKFLIAFLFRKVSVPVQWIHETIDILDRDHSGQITLSELVITLRDLWKKMKSAKRISKL